MTITTREQWLEAALPLVIMQIESAHDVNEYDPDLHGLLLSMPHQAREQFPQWDTIRMNWWFRYAWRWRVSGSPGGWGCRSITTHAVLPWLRDSIVDGDLDTLADAASLAVPAFIGPGLCKQLLDAVEDLLARWDADGVEDFTEAEPNEAGR